MIKKLFLYIIIAALFIVAVGIFIKKYSAWNPTAPDIGSKSTSITINSVQIPVEIAKTEIDRQKGLGGRNTLDSASGMLFIFDDKTRIQSFWMKDMLIPIDIIWIKGGKVIRIDKTIEPPPTGTPDSKLKTYSAGTVVDYVLEVNSGFSDKNSIKVGDTVSSSGI